MIRVVHVMTRTNIGGPSVMLVDLLNGLDDNEFEQTIIRGSASASEGDYLAQHPVNCEVITLGELRRSLGVIQEIRSLIVLVRCLRRIKPHVVHTHMAKAGVIGRLAALLARVPVRVHTFHGHLLHGYFSPIVSKGFVFVERMLRRITSFALVVGAATRRDLLAVGIVTESSSAVVLPATKPITLANKHEARTRLGLPTSGVIVGLVGRLTHIKRPDRFLRLAEAIPDVHFVLVGGGPQRSEVETQARLINNASVIDWSADLSVVFGALDLVALTSDNEGVPLSLLEAASAGLPVVAMRVGGVPEIIDDGVTGLLADNESDLAAHVRILAADPARRDEMGRAARALVAQRTSLRSYLSQHEELYRRLSSTGDGDAPMPNRPH